jgi:RHH-type rel operon transcriptional repressor/antitoxin RelB
LTQALLQRMDELDDVFVAEERLANIRAGRADVVPIESIMQRYGMAY